MYIPKIKDERQKSIYHRDRMKGRNVYKDRMKDRNIDIETRTNRETERVNIELNVHPSLGDREGEDGEKERNGDGQREKPAIERVNHGKSSRGNRKEQRTDRDRERKRE